MPSGNLHNLVRTELSLASLDVFDSSDTESILFTTSAAVTKPNRIALVKLDANGNVEAYGTPADVDWGVASNGEASNEAAITLVAPSGGANAIGLFSEWPGRVPPGPNWIALARLPGNATISGGTSAVFNAGSIRFSWGKATDGTTVDDSTSDLRNKLASMLIDNPNYNSPNVSTLQSIYQPFQHSWLVLYTQDRSSYLASVDLYLKWNFPTSDVGVSKNSEVITLTNNTGSTFTARYASIWLRGTTSTDLLNFNPSAPNMMKAFEKLLEPAIVLQNGQQLQIPVGQLTVTVS